MRVAVLIPWRATSCTDRRRALEYIQGRYHREYPDWQVAIGHCDEGPWVKAAAVAAALRQTNAEVVIVADADVWCDDLAVAVELVAGGVPWAIAHRGVFRLTEAGTARYIAGDALDGLPLAERAYLGVEGGGLVVIRRAVYTACPLDPRFVGWGSEDDAWGFALRTLHGAPWRGRGALAHLWHPPQDRATRSYGSLGGRDLRKRYARARLTPTAMNQLVREAITHDAHSATESPSDACAALRCPREP